MSIAIVFETHALIEDNERGVAPERLLGVAEHLLSNELEHPPAE
jgi:hypothetical protein